MQNFVSHGDTVTVTAPSGTDDVDVTAGALVKVGAIVGVAVNDAETGDEVTLLTRGVFDVAKVSAQAWAVGDLIYYAAATRNATTTSSGNTLIGVAVAAAANPSSTGRVRLDGAFGR